MVHILLIGDPRFGGNEERGEETHRRNRRAHHRGAQRKEPGKAFDQISEELRSQYTLGYYSTNAARDGTYRKIKVETDRKDIDVLTRRGYYAPTN